MITDEERKSIINEAVEKALLLLPEIVGNLIMNQANHLRLNKKFYDQYPDFASKKDVVASVVEMIERESPGTDYAEILKRAVPVVKERMRMTSALNMTDVSRPSRNLKLAQSNNGEL
jgi:hypothetical protein